MRNVIIELTNFFGYSFDTMAVENKQI